ncbi:MAG: hypothetical protein JEZ08_10490 [Clostridiales bacterium]|nr:hypothetical protein [Clostridiales bacterium]
MSNIIKKIFLVSIISIVFISCSEKVYDNSSYLQDYDYLWVSLEESYPYFGVLERSGIDWVSVKHDYREMIKNTYMDNSVFSKLLDQMLDEFRGNGHLNVISRDFYHMARYVYSDSGTTEWLSILEKPRSEVFYNYDENHFDANESFNNGNIESELFQEEGILYINVKSFRYENIEHEQDILFDLYEQIEAYDDLIIDIRENRGGATRYFSRNIVEPLINEPLYIEEYMLYSENDYNKPFIECAIEKLKNNNETELSQRYGEILSLDQMPEFEMINESDLLNLNRVIKFSTQFVPNNEFEFNGRIWVLVGNRVYSASDAFAQMCEQTGFATLVGHSTGGDGVGLDPILISLPESGIIIRFSTHYGLNLNGQNNEEFGTTPDILLDYDDSAYEKVLELIRENK